MPIGTERGSLTVTGPDGAKVRVVVPVLNPPAPRPETLDGFVEANGYVSIEAEHFTRAVAPAGTAVDRHPRPRPDALGRDAPGP